MKTGRQMKDAMIEAGVRKTSLPPAKMFFSAILAGMFIALGAYGSQHAGLYGSKVVSSLVFPIGLTMVIFTGSELFTGNSLITMALFNKRVTLKAMLKNWGIVYLGNLCGSLLVAVPAGLLASGDLAQAMINAAAAKTALPLGIMFLKAILCNVLVCLAVFCALCSDEAAGKFPALYLPTFLFVLCGYEHSIANMYFIPAAITAGATGIFAGMLVNLIVVTIGNVVGGTLISWLLHQGE